MQVQRIQNNKYNTNINAPRFCGTANLQKIRQFVNVAEPETVKDIIKGSLDEYVKWWIKTPDETLKHLFQYNNLNSYLKHKNIEVLLNKRGAFYYDVNDLLTDENYELAVQLAKNHDIPLCIMRGLLSMVNEDKSQLESVLKLYKSKCENVSDKSNSNSNFGKLIFNPKSKVGEFGRCIAGYYNTQKYWDSFPNVIVDVENNREIKKLCDYLRECQYNLVVSLDGTENNLYIELRTEADSFYDGIWTSIRVKDLKDFKSDSIILEHKKKLIDIKESLKEYSSYEQRCFWTRHNNFTSETVQPKSRNSDGTYNY